MTTAELRIKTRLVVIDEEVRKTVLEVLERTPYYAGPETAAFEAELAAYCGVRHGVAANSGTSCLLLALLARGIGRGDEVILPSNTFVSVPECVLFAGATPIFTDVESDGNLSRAIVERHLSPRTRAVLPVHMFGHPVDMDPIIDLARERGLYVIEDAAHALGARYKGRRAGSLGHVGFFSFAGKSITVCGQAGMAVTNDAALADAMAGLRVHGWDQEVGNVWHVAERVGLNLRTSETGVHYPVPLHLQPAFQAFAPDPSAFPVTDAMAAEMLTLPSHPWMSDHDVDVVADAVLSFYRR